jgi:hypothetical protein
MIVEDGPMKGTWLMGAMKAVDFGLVEQHLLSLREDPITAIAPQVKKLEEMGQHAMARRMERMAFRETLKKKEANRIPANEVQEWIDSIDGLLFTTWIMLRKNHPEMTLEKTQQIYDAVGEQEMRKRRDKAATLDLLGNSTGPALARDAGPAGANGTSRSTGEPSTDGLPGNTDSAQPSSAK